MFCGLNTHNEHTEATIGGQWYDPSCPLATPDPVTLEICSTSCKSKSLYAYVSHVCVCACVCAYVCVHMYVCVHDYVCACACVCVCMCTCMCVCMCVCVCMAEVCVQFLQIRYLVSPPVCVHVCMCMCVSVYVCMCVCVCVFMCVFVWHVHVYMMLCWLNTYIDHTQGRVSCTYRHVPLYSSSWPTHWCHCCAVWSHICQCLLDCTNLRWSSDQI